MIRRSKFLVTLAIVCTVISASCSIRHERLVRITNPSPGQVFNYGELINITVSGPAQPGALVEVIVANRVWTRRTVPAGSNPNQIISYTNGMNARPPGVVMIYARVLQAGADPRVSSSWLYSNDVCIYIRDSTHTSPPEGLNECRYVPHVDPIVVAPTATPTTRPLIRPVPITPNSGGGNGGGSGNTSCPPGYTYTCEPVCGCAPP